MRQRRRDDITFTPSKLEMKESHLRLKRLKVKKHRKCRKKSFYKTRFWEMHFKGDCNQKRFMKRLERLQTLKERRLKRDKVKYLIVSQSMFSFHSGAHGITYIFKEPGGRIIEQQTVEYWLSEEELMMKVAMLGYDDFMQSSECSFAIE